MKRRAWLLLLLVAVIFSADFLISAYNKYHEANPERFGMFWGRQGWLYTHLAGGALAILMGPLQLAREHLGAFQRFHRWTGRLYMVGIVIGCVGAIGLLANSPAPFGIRAAFAVTLCAWVFTSTKAIWSIRHGDVARHRTWMIRNYLVTLAPVVFRLLLPAALAIGLTPSPDLIAALLWASWTMPLLVYEVFARSIRASTNRMGTA